ncbi:MAG TPA: DNA polymerase sliding clamp [Pyrodictium sp.]|nr:DNA polymerase sliding clamp [Pyrodictium sp.]
MTFKAIYPAATKFKYIVETITKALDEIPFMATAEGLYVKSLSPDKTTMLVLTMPVTTFEEYNVEKDKVVFVVPSDELKRAAKRGTRNDMVELVLEEDQRRLKMTFIDKKTGVTRTFYIPLREAVVEELNEPQVELNVVARLNADDFKNIVRDAKIVSDEVEFTAHEDRLEAHSLSMQKEYRCIMEIGNPLITYEVKGNPPIRAKYAIDLLQASLKAASTADTVTVEFGEALPMKLTFDLPGGSTLVYWVSPRV